MTGNRLTVASSRRAATTTNEAIVALRALRTRGLDERLASPELGPLLSSSLGAVLVALRWAAVMSGLGWAATAAANGDLRVVGTLTVAVFMASWRTVRPVRLGDPSRSQRLGSLVDVAILGAAAGFSAGLASPFIGCVLVAVGVAAFGWGLRQGLVAAAIGLASTLAVASMSGPVNLAPLALSVTALAAAAIFPGVARPRLIQAEARRRDMARQMGQLEEANDLLGSLNQLARTLPSSLDLTDVLTAAKTELKESFDATRYAILALEDRSWSPLVQDGFTVSPASITSELPTPFGQAARDRHVLRIDDLSNVSDRTGSGLYVRLVVNGQDAGLLVAETDEVEAYTEAHAERFTGTADMLALTISNARSFGQLRSLAAAEERTRIARDLHDRLGQWLTFIAFELERINAEGSEPSPELDRLHHDVQGAIAELRDTLIELRAAVSADRPLSIVLAEVVDRFRMRSDLEVTLTVPPEVGVRLSAVVENELLRIAQEALTNVDKHADATAVHVGWSIEAGRGVLVVSDDGRGFVPGSGIRGTAYGLVGMRERAASVGSILEISSQPNQGTVITVLTSPTDR